MKDNQNISADFPFASKYIDVHEAVSAYSTDFKTSTVPKLMFYAQPGAIIDAAGLQWCKDNMNNLKTVDIGKGIHYLQEDNPYLIGKELAAWYQTL